ncbi:hypothetical protein CEXT_651191 [Caerostris extrusa]|uniref:Uncharacterized protein n=1 Tax=Caerostris extrusa TaxID=172846 RepID=A0AAV4Y5N0_CAEEX|nr:hypothetical protein CEXT_651191 [Caerostris extrusa]
MIFNLSNLQRHRLKPSTDIHFPVPPSCRDRHFIAISLEPGLHEIAIYFQVSPSCILSSLEPDIHQIAIYFQVSPSCILSSLEPGHPFHEIDHQIAIFPSVAIILEPGLHEIAIYFQVSPSCILSSLEPGLHQIAIYFVTIMYLFPSVAIMYILSSLEPDIHQIAIYFQVSPSCILSSLEPGIHEIAIHFQVSPSCSLDIHQIAIYFSNHQTSTSVAIMYFIESRTLLSIWNHRNRWKQLCAQIAPSQSVNHYLKTEDGLIAEVGGVRDYDTCR